MDFSEPHFAEPLRLWALPLAGALLGILWWRASAVRRKALATVAAPAMLANLLRGHSPARRAVKTAVFASAIFLILIAIARPRWGFVTSSNKQETEDIVFILDTSRSMTARDVAPSRLARAKQAIDTFVGAHPSGRVGLVAFAGEAFLQCPPTADRDIFRDTLAELDTEVIPTPGTDIGAALEEGNTAFGEQKGRRTLILLTDGEDLSGQGVEIAKKLGASGVVVQAVGIGGSGYELADRSGGVVKTLLDEPTLKAIAKASGGEYFRLGGPGDTFASVETGLERTVSASGEDRAPVDRYAIPLVIALLLLAAEALLGTRRKLPSAGLAKAATLLVVIGFSIHDARAESSEADKSPEALYDLGTKALKNDQFREAGDYLKNVLADCDDALRPLALHNLGQARARDALKALEKRESPLGKINTLKGSTRSSIETVEKILRDADAGGKLDEQAAAGAIQSGKAVRKTTRKELPPHRQSISEGEVALKNLRRGRDDFLGAYELNPADTDAKKNADLLQVREESKRSEVQKEQSAAEETQKADQELKKKIKELSKHLKKQQGDPQSGEPEDDDEEDEDEQEKSEEKQNKPDNRTEEQRRKAEGKAGRMTREEAQAALESMSEDMRRKLQFGNQPDPAAVKRARESGNDR